LSREFPQKISDLTDLPFVQREVRRMHKGRAGEKLADGSLTAPICEDYDHV